MPPSAKQFSFPRLTKTVTSHPSGCSAMIRYPESCTIATNTLSCVDVPFQNEMKIRARGSGFHTNQPLTRQTRPTKGSIALTITSLVSQFNFVDTFFLYKSHKAFKMKSFLFDPTPTSMFASVSNFTSRSSSPTFNPQHCHSTYCIPKSEDGGDYTTDFKLDEDQTSIRIIMEMPGVKGGDISVSVEAGILTIQGYRRSTDGRKKQRLQRRFPIDTQVVDITRAVANIWKDVLILYAPKSPVKIAIPITEEPEFEFHSPAAQHLLFRDTATE